MSKRTTRMTIGQFLKTFKIKAKGRKWTLTSWGRLRTADNDCFCPIEFLQGHHEIAGNKLLSRSDTLAIMNASDDGLAYDSTLRKKLLRAAGVKE